MAIKMIVSDLDGTMIDETHRIPAANALAVKEALRAGIVVTFATGRMYCSALPYAEELGITAPLITYNGAVVKTPAGDLVGDSHMDGEVVRAVLDYCFERDIYVQLYADDKLYYAEPTEKSQAYEKAAGIKGQAVGWEGLLQCPGNLEKLLVIGDTPEAADDIVVDLNVRFSGSIAAMKSTGVYIEVIKPSVSKAGAMLMLAEKYGIRAEEIMALGDSFNDISMLKAAGCSVAMGNAEDIVKEAAHYVTGNCADGGLAEAIRKYALRRVGEAE